jgi:NAD(P)-dependent dehydrogenase (short-subunit alcohol dehydrogenase family)
MGYAWVVVVESHRPHLCVLGPYLLTRLLEPRLIASAPSRVVNLSSVTHRYGDITSAEAFLRKKEKGLGKEYPATKLANTLFAFEHQRRLGHLGVQVITSCYKHWSSLAGFAAHRSVLAGLAHCAMVGKQGRRFLVFRGTSLGDMSACWIQPRLPT